jgi:perosamine synthetase
MNTLYFGFNSCHDQLSKTQLVDIKKLVQKKDIQIVNEYETKFIDSIGNGYGFSVASGRMAFYLLLKHLGISENDEVIVLGFTCSVMINAILRVGAKPVYSDVNISSFGSDPKKIEENISSNTKMIVAQHSFGIPCDIKEIVRLGKQHNIFVLEDCALALGSSVSGVQVGNFGDAAIFSTDHSKPLNTLIGGFFYTKNIALFESVKSSIDIIPELSKEHQKNLYRQLVFEKIWHSPRRYKFKKAFLYYNKVRKKIIGKKLLFMDGDNGPPDRIQPKYPYPSRLPAFLAQLGMFELERFGIEKKRRVDILKKYLDIFEGSTYRNEISRVYLDEEMQIVPLRFVFTTEKSSELKSKLSALINFSQIWFKNPIIATSYDLEDMGYKNGMCPIGESIGKMIINFPCVIPEEFEDLFFRLLKKQMLSIN